MTLISNRLRTVAVASAIACAAVSASAQTSSPSPPHEHGTAPHAAPAAGRAFQIAVLDERIAMLLADMKRFNGELKVQTMASLIEALLERQTLVEREMQSMHDRMRHSMPELKQDYSPIPAEMEPETMCSPFV